MVSVEWFGFAESCNAAVEPPVCQLHGLLRITVVAVAGGAFVEGHHDVGADDALYVHNVLGGEKVFAAVDMAAEGATLFFYFSIFCQREDLETTAVGEQRPLPAVELVQAAGLAQYVATRTEV